MTRKPPEDLAPRVHLRWARGSRLARWDAARAHMHFTLILCAVEVTTEGARVHCMADSVGDCHDSPQAPSGTQLAQPGSEKRATSGWPAGRGTAQDQLASAWRSVCWFCGDTPSRVSDASQAHASCGARVGDTSTKLVAPLAQ